MNIQLKSSNVSYTLNSFRKTLSVPLIGETFSFGTGMKDPVWKKAAVVDDFVVCRKNTLPERKTTLSVFRTGKELFLGIFLEESEADRVRPPEGAVSAWSGDMVELHFGSISPDPWLMQLAVGISGIRFDSTGGFEFWESKIFETAEGWGLEVRLPLHRLRITEGGVYFELCRQAVKRKENSVWNPLYKRYHEVENFGELLFASYAETAWMRTGCSFPETMNRKEFEAARKEWEIFSNQTIHGPYLSFPEQDKVCVTWETAGKVPGFVEYRRKDSPEILRSDCSKQGGILLYNSLHFTQLNDLLPDTEYEYRLCTLLPVVETRFSDERWRSFRTAPAEGKAFSFFTYSDLHSNAAFLRAALQTPEAEKALFHMSLGDNLSHAAGRECLFEGVINPFVEANQQRGKEIPLVFVRGNHEQLGIFAPEYFHVMKHPSGRTWYTFLCGNAFFTVLDSGDDKADSPERMLFSNTGMMEEEKEFLKQVTASKEYQNARFRIILVHMPPFRKYPWVFDLIQPLEEAQVKPDLMICGHEHRFARINGNSGRIVSPEPENSQWAAQLQDMSFATVIHATNNVLSIDVEDQLSVQVLERKADGRFSLSDEFRMTCRK